MAWKPYSLLASHTTIMVDKDGLALLLPQVTYRLIRLVNRLDLLVPRGQVVGHILFGPTRGNMCLDSDGR